MKAAKLTAVFVAALAVAAQAAAYVITGSGTSFTARLGSASGTVVAGADGKPVQTVIDAIKADAAGTASAIQFGDGTSVLNIGEKGIELDGLFVSDVETPFFSEDFEGASSFTAVNGSGSNEWRVGTAVAKGGTKSAYISDDGGASNHYDDDAASVVHMYKNITFPAGSSGYVLTFDWKGLGERGYDDLNVFLAEPSVTPVAGEELGEWTQHLGAYSESGDWRKASIGIPSSNSGTTKRLVFSWHNDDGWDVQPPIAVDNIAIAKATLHQWEVTLGGKLTSSDDDAAIVMSNGISVSSTADITYTTDHSAGIVNNGTGTLTISGGTLLAAAYGGYAVINAHTGAVTISGGTISSTGNADCLVGNDIGTVNISGGTISNAGYYGNAVCNYGIGVVNISGGTVSVSGTYGYGVFNEDDGIVSISGGKISAAGDYGEGVYNNSTSAVTISGGMISATTGYALYNDYVNPVILSGGLLFSYGTAASDVAHGAVTISGNPAIVAWDKAAGVTSYAALSSTHLAAFPSLQATATWDVRGGISYANGANTGFFAVSGVAVSAGSPAIQPQMAGGSIRLQTTENAMLLENLPKNARIEVYTLQGRRIHSAHSDNSEILRILVKTKGIYIVKVSSSSETRTFKAAVK